MDSCDKQVIRQSDTGQWELESVNLTIRFVSNNEDIVDILQSFHLGKVKVGREGLVQLARYPFYTIIRDQKLHGGK